MSLFSSLVSGRGPVRSVGATARGPRRPCLVLAAAALVAAAAPAAGAEGAPGARESAATIRGKVIAAGQPVSGVRVHAYADASAGFAGDGIAVSAPSAADGSYSLDLTEGGWYLVAKSSPQPSAAAGAGVSGLFGYYGGNPVALAAGKRVTANLQVVSRRPPVITPAPPGRSVLAGVVLGPDGPVADASVYVYLDASRQFRGPDLFGPLGAVAGGTDERGAFSVEVPPGSYFLVASRRKTGDVLGPLHPGDLHGWYDANPVTLAAGATTTVTIQTVAKLRDTDLAVAAASGRGSAGIRGRLRDPSGKVPAGAYAFATTDPSFMIGAMPPHRSLPVGPDGTYFIELPAGGGTFYVSARSGYGGPPLPGEWHGFHGEGQPAPVVVEPDRVVEGIDVLLKRME